MQLFRNILVGVDPTRLNPLESATTAPSVFEPIRWGIELAKASSARLTFFSASNVGEEALMPLDEEDRSFVLQTVLQGGNRLLENLAKQAAAQGVEARCKLAAGDGWLEIIRQVLRDNHDLVVVGTRDRTKLGHVLFGNTSMKLLRRCPCPVLVTKPRTNTATEPPRNGSAVAAPMLHFLVATNLRPPSEETLRLGISLAQQCNAHLHVLHVVEYALHEVCNIGLPDSKQEKYRKKAREQAEQTLQAQLEKTDYKALGSRVSIHMAGDVDLPDVAIQRFIETHRIDLLVMGTIARGGIRGIMIGDTAERLLHEVGCSVLAVKPADFVCPVER